MPIPTDSPLVLSLSSDERVSGSNVTFAFTDAGTTVDTTDINGSDSTARAWSETQKDFVRDTFTYIATVVDLTFEEVQDVSTAIMDFTQIDFLDEDVTGYSAPGEFVGESEIVMPTEYIGFNDVTIIHEIGHSLGLSHPFDGESNLPGVSTDADLGDFNLNTELATRMSYTPGASSAHPGLDILGEPLAYGAIDIAALQLLYGANTRTGLGDTTYNDDIGRFSTIWDNGGVDTIDYSGAADNVVIDLRSATLAVEAGGGGYISYVARQDGTVADGGYTIAYEVEVENGIGGSGADMLTGNQLANSLIGGRGDDMLDGGAGIDTAGYSGNQTSYTLTLNASGTTVQDRRSDGNGTDQLTAVELLSFDTGISDGAFDLTKFAGTQNLTEDQMGSFVELYIAYFNRAPDAVGLNFWGTAFANGTTLQEMATLFIDQEETRQTYDSSLSNANFATAVYANVLGRVADQDGFDFWVGVLEAGSRGRDQFILSVLEGAKAAPRADATQEFIAQQQADQQFLSNKTDIGEYFAVIKGMSDVTNAASVMSTFTGSAQSINDAIAAADGFYSSALSADGGEFLMPLIGVVDDPFAVA